MSSLQDTLYNWLSIKVVSDARRDDSAAKETVDLFQEMLKKDFNITSLTISKDEELYYIHYVHNNEEALQRFPKELIECILNGINEHPERYQNYE